MMRYILPCLTAVSLLLAPGPGWADETAARLYSQGQKKLNIGEMDSAIKLFRSAAQKTRDPKLTARIQLQLGVIQVIRNNNETARQAFQKALRADPELRPDPFRYKPAVIRLYRAVRLSMKGGLYITADMVGATVKIDGKAHGNTPLTTRLPVGAHHVEVWSPDRKSSHKQKVTIRVEGVARIQAWLQRSRGRISVLSRPPGARVFLDGAMIGKTPLLEMPVKTGDHEVRITHGGYKDLVRSVDVTGKDTAKLDVTLVKPAAPAGEASPPRRRLWTWITAGAALATAVAGVSLGASAMGDMDDYEQLTASDQQQLDELEAAMENKALAANVMYGVAGALAVTSIVLFFLEGRAGSTEHRDAAGRATKLRLAPSIGATNGVVVRIVF